MYRLGWRIMALLFEAKAKGARKKNGEGGD